MDRRQLGKGLAGGIAAGILGPRGAVAVVPEGAAEWVQVLPGVWKARIGVPERVTPVSSGKNVAKVEALKKMAVVSAPPLAVPLGKVGPRGVEMALPLAAHEEVYGFGLQLFTVAQRAKKRVIRVNADPKADSGDTHAPVPFYVTNQGYGVFVDTARCAVFCCGNSRAKPTAGASKEIEAGVTPRYDRNLSPEQASQVLIEVPNATGVDVYLFAGPTMLDAVRRYNLFSGGGVMPPEWGLGFWYRTTAAAVDKQAIAMAEEFRERKMPCDVFGIEPGWQTHAYSCSFMWNKERFPDPAGFVKALHEKDYRVNLWEHAFTHPSSPLFADLVNLAGDRGVWGGLVPDFEDAKARKVFGDFHGRTLIDLGGAGEGVDGFKLDECDNSDFTNQWSFPDFTQFPSGVDGEQMHGLFGLRYQQAIWEQYKQRGRETYSLVRSSGALATPYPFVLYSDLYDHRQFVRGLVNAGFSGLLWCPEVRDAVSEEDLIRRLQTVVFSPLAMINGWYIANPTWKQIDRKKNNANEFSPGWETLEERCREIIGWRMEFIPYLRAAFAKYAADGTPPFRALALDWPEVHELAGVDDAWMMGDRVLVAAMFAGEAGRSLTLPPGQWHDFWTGKLVAGGTKLRFEANERNLPVFVKAGSVLPLAAVTNSTKDEGRKVLEVRVFGDGGMAFDGVGVRLSWGGGAGKVEGGGGYSVGRWVKAGSVV